MRGRTIEFSAYLNIQIFKWIHWLHNVVSDTYFLLLSLFRVNVFGSLYTV